MRTITSLTYAFATMITLGGCAGVDTGRPEYGYDYNRPDPAYGGYDASRYYRDSPHYRERQLAQDARVYRGNDGKLYCRRSDGTTGLVIGALAGGVLGNIIAPGGSELLGTVLGAAGGGLAGRAVDRGKTSCR